MKLIDPELLRTFIAFIDSGSLARAAEIVGRSPSAVTAQMQRLEDAIGEPLLAPAGRGRALTPAGEDLAGHARRILEAHREAWLSLSGSRADGRAALGATQDFAESVLPGLLRTFARTHARVRLELRIGRTAELTKAYEEGAIDVLLAMRGNPSADEIGIVTEPMLWLAAKDGLAASHAEVPLALLDPPCGFRSAALASLDSAGRPYRIAAMSATLTGLRAAVSGGLAVTLRTSRMCDGNIVAAPPSLALPETSSAVFSLRARRAAEQAALALAELLAESLDARRP